MSQESAQARIHRRDQLKLRREFGLARGARHADAARFKRLAKYFEDIAAELRQLIEKQHAVHRH